MIKECKRNYFNVFKILTGEIKVKYSKNKVLGYPNPWGTTYGWCRGFYFTGNVKYKV